LGYNNRYLYYIVYNYNELLICLTGTLVPDLTWDNFGVFMDELEQAPPDQLIEGAGTPSFYGRALSEIIHNICRNLKIDSKRKQVTTQYRARDATSFVDGAAPDWSASCDEGIH
jgi:hypothetical protein